MTTVESAAPTRRAECMQFGILTAEDIRSMSVTTKIIINGEEIEAGLSKPDPYIDGQAAYGAVHDPRMGPSARGFKCDTCKCDDTLCPGHFGHIELEEPVFNLGYVGYIYKIVQVICFNCGRLLADEEDPKIIEAQSLPPEQRLETMFKLCRTRRVCDGKITLKDGSGNARVEHGCGFEQPKWKRENIKIMYQHQGPDQDDKLKQLRPKDFVEMAAKMDEQEERMLGFDPKFARPRSMCVEVVPVAPPVARPSVQAGNTRSEDDLTYMYNNIIKANQALKSANNGQGPETAKRDKLDQLQFYIAALADNEANGLPRVTQSQGGRALKTVRQRLKGKYGRVRGNLMGKRVNFSSRSVITPDPSLSIDEVGVPKTIAQELTFPERVNEYNKKWLLKLVHNGPETHPGAVSLTRTDGVTIDLRIAADRTNQQLDTGCIVERHLIDGDYVLFNRQPSLHKMSIMGHRVKVLNYSTFRLNLAVTAPYNADFDGDEMNMHVPQTETARAEVRELMMVPRNIISPKNNSPVMGIVQDSLLGVQKMTKRDVFLNREQMMTLSMFVAQERRGRLPVPAIIIPKEGKPGQYKGVWTGKQLFGMCLPKVNLRVTSNSASKHELETRDPLTPSDGLVLIEDGELLHGIVDKKTVGSKGNSLIHVVCNDFTFDEAREFMDTVQVLVNNWLLYRGFTIGASDTKADERTMKQVAEIVQENKGKVDDVIKAAFVDKELEAEPGMSLMDTFEYQVNDPLNKARGDSGKKAQDSLDETNNIKATVTAGSKGGPNNIAQIMGCVGQQNVEGKRIAFGFSHRTLPHFLKYDLGPDSKGFVEHSYLQGLEPTEFYFHMMGGREGLIDTAVKTARTGYIQRRLVKAMEDVMVQYDGTVRNSVGQVLQFLYGEDGMDGRWIEEQPCDLHTLSKEKFEERYRLNFDSSSFGRVSETSPVYFIQQLPNTEEAMRRHESELRELLKDRKTLAEIKAAQGNLKDTRLHLPVNINRLIWTAKKQFQIDMMKPTDMGPVEVLDAVSNLIDSLKVIDGYGEDDAFAQEAQSNAKVLLSIALRATLASKPVLRDHRLSREAFAWLCGEIQSRFEKARVCAGEMCGIIAAQSIGEPATQMTLNTFHSAGISAKNVTLGVPRLDEIINVSKSIKAPSLTIRLSRDIENSISEMEANARDMAKVVEDPEERQNVLREEMGEVKIQIAKLAAPLAHLTLRRLATASEIFWDPDPRSSTIESDRAIVEDFVSTETHDDGFYEGLSPWVLRIELDPGECAAAYVKMEQVRTALNNRFNASETMAHIVSSGDTGEGPDGRPLRFIRMRCLEDPEASSASAIEVLKTLEAATLDDQTVKGIMGITRVFNDKYNRVDFDEEEGIVVLRDAKFFETNGSALADVFANEDIDFSRTISNDLIEVLDVLGIEAVRQAIMNEIRVVLDKYGLYVNYRHLGLLADVMTSRGQLMAIARNGINRANTGIIQRASYEETMELFFKAGAFALRDELMGVSQRILLGQMCTAGTGAFDLMLDMDVVKEAAVVRGLDDDDDDFEDGGWGTTDMGRTPKAASNTPGFRTPGAATPGAMTPGLNSPVPAFSPEQDHMDAQTPGYFTPSMASPHADYGPMSPSASPGRLYNPASPRGPLSGAASPGYGPRSRGPASGGYGTTSPGYSPSSPGYSPTSPGYSPTSPGYSPTSPGYSPTSPGYSPTSPGYSPTSPGYSPTSPGYSPTSPGYSPTSPGYSPTSPGYSPTSPGYSPTSPGYSPTSPGYSPTSPGYSPTSPGYSPTSPGYSPTSPGYSPTSPGYSPTSPGYSPTSPGYSPTSPGYSPSASGPSPTSPGYSPTSPGYSPTSPGYSPTSPGYSPPSPGDSPERDTQE